MLGSTAPQGVRVHSREHSTAESTEQQRAQQGGVAGAAVEARTRSVENSETNQGWVEHAGHRWPHRRSLPD